MPEEIDRFQAVEVDGTSEYTIVVIQRQVAYKSRMLDGSTEYFTDAGLNVTRRPNGDFDILELGVVVRAKA